MENKEFIIVIQANTDFEKLNEIIESIGGKIKHKFEKRFAILELNQAQTKTELQRKLPTEIRVLAFEDNIETSLSGINANEILFINSVKNRKSERFRDLKATRPMHGVKWGKGALVAPDNENNND